MEVSDNHAAPAAVLQGTIPGTHRIGGSMDCRASLDDLEKRHVTSNYFQIIQSVRYGNVCSLIYVVVAKNTSRRISG